MIRYDTKAFKLILAAFITFICFSIIWLATWQSPDVNHFGETNIHTGIHSDDRKLHFKLDAGDRDEWVLLHK